ncbi:MAG: ferritin-like domain-containing protein [Gemmatimonadota bacterium]
MTHEAYHGTGSNGNGMTNGTGHRNGAAPANLRRLYAEQLVGIRAAERQSAEVFPDMAIVAADEGVASVFRAAASDTEVQLARLDQLIRGLELPAAEVATPELDGILDEIRAVLEGGAEVTAGDVDAALLRAAREGLRHQIAGYETACATARRLGDYRSLDVLLQSLDEELTTDSSFSRLMSHHSRLARTN